MSNVGKSYIGDLNGDGLADFNTGEGSRIIFGAKSFPAIFNADSLNGRNGFSIISTIDTNGDWGVNTAGDFNGDGIKDLFLGFGHYQSTYLGYAYIIYGAPSFPASIDLSSITSSQGLRLNGMLAGDTFGFTGGNIGDFNKDGMDDIFIGAPDIYSSAGMGFVFFGSRNLPAQLNAEDLNGQNGFAVIGSASGDKFGFAMNYIGKRCNTSHDSFAVTAWGADNQAGKIYVFGAAGQETYPAKVNLTDPYSLYFDIVNGTRASSEMGWNLSGGKDINGDDIDDFVISVPFGTYDAGAYVIFGQAMCDPGEL